jgi:hypothetical protein
MSGGMAPDKGICPEGIQPLDLAVGVLGGVCWSGIRVTGQLLHCGSEYIGLKKFRARHRIYH